MRVISITDVTMRQSVRGTDLGLSFREKIELTKLLDRLGAAVIETSPITRSRIDSLLIRSIASAVKESVVAVPVGLDPENVPLARRALEEAAHPRLVVETPVSAVQMEYLAGKKPAAVLAAVSECVAAARAACDDVEFAALDATRADPAFLLEVLRAAVAAGAVTVTVCDAAGAMLPDEFGAFVSALRRDVPELERVTLGVGCCDTLHMADACAVAAIQAGAGEIKAAACNLNAADLEHLAALLAARGESLGVSTGVRVTQLHRLSEQIRRLCRSGAAAETASNLQSGEDEVFLTAHDDIAAVLKVVAQLGYELSEEDGARVYEAFGRIAARKERVGARELDAIVASAAMQVPPTYLLESYVINTGNDISASAHMKLSRSGAPLEGISLGDGPIDAAFHTIDEIIGHHYELDDFQIQAVTQGRDSMGEAVVKLRSAGKLYSGRGISTDIIGASIHAYLSALNKIVYEEGGV